MKLFDRIRSRIRNGVNRMAEGVGAFKKDVFELDGVPAFREYYTLFIFAWQAIFPAFIVAIVRFLPFGSFRVFIGTSCQAL